MVQHNINEGILQNNPDWVLMTLVIIFRNNTTI
jgi:hypothetical protein